jgi:hypothetical protein
VIWRSQKHQPYTLPGRKNGRTMLKIAETGGFITQMGNAL